MKTLGVFVGISSGFKPYYKWIIFNIDKVMEIKITVPEVLNLIING